MAAQIAMKHLPASGGHSRESALLSGDNEALQKMRDARQFFQKI
ncbi:hypothetical protein [Dyella sp.]|nr:hypothetical protein [Dyella sp.]HET7331984.1 hypothetical protein [Dyella sp.]